ncbi:glutamate racemase [Deinococcus maricopensis]|uniref:Glutamate racemase n=1 Tax=Deinococcus maricopensis (strain DSM 21211 / LMG 22137 / NRRL B-23946 / LB-34) TaxID=709986 RepID=E8UAG6_DEIML|nr:glutamate racemase [Deinococcus maricopensis]ADV68055.1 Glutamate racemase [Deinococcus maricopensis DSM 21211]
MTAADPHPHAPIGVFDSGVGGLSVLAALRRELPNEDYLYLADTAHVPYGPRADDDIRDLTGRAARWLFDHGAKSVVVACNTASAFSLAPLRAWAGDARPVVGLVPAVKPAVAATRSGVIGVLATPATLRGALLQDVVAQHATPRGVRVVPCADLRLVPLVESGLADAPETLAALRETLDPVVGAGADALVLGCTHYPFLTSALRHLYGPDLALFDSGAGVARRTRAVLAERGLLRAPTGTPGTVRAFTTGDPAASAGIIERLHGAPLGVTRAHATLALS